ncbi:MAG: hypothetical protein GY864_06550 [Desulfobacterales bacterium]|nr:hypothetical protein [Desulfobacterales bacterium]
MDGMKEKFTIKMTDKGVAFLDKDGNRLDFTASEALMLLDILRSEETKLKEMAEQAAPVPIKIKF